MAKRGQPSNAHPGAAAVERALKPRAYARRLAVNKPGGVILYIGVSRVDWIEAANQYVRLHVGNRSHLLRESMSRLESWLDPQHFIRVHRSVIVNLDRVHQLRVISPVERFAMLSTGNRVRISGARWDKLRNALVWPA
jgi:two-component system, LytTR family, response regulator